MFKISMYRVLLVPPEPPSWPFGPGGHHETPQIPLKEVVKKQHF
jgi:hypothetical protein